MPKLYYYTWLQGDKDNAAVSADDLKLNPHWVDLQTKVGDNVFIYGGPSGAVTDITKGIDKQNIAIVKREFKLLNLEKKNRMVDTQVQNIIGKDNISAQKQRTIGIVSLNDLIIGDFLRYLDRMLWENKAKGIQSTISFDDAYDLAKPIFQDLLNITATIIDDTYNNTITDKEISDAVEKSKLKQEQITSDGIFKKSKK